MKKPNNCFSIAITIALFSIIMPVFIVPMVKTIKRNRTLTILDNTFCSLYDKYGNSLTNITDHIRSEVAANKDPWGHSLMIASCETARYEDLAIRIWSVGADGKSHTEDDASIAFEPYYVSIGLDIGTPRSTLLSIGYWIPRNTIAGAKNPSPCLGSNEGTRVQWKVITQ